MAQETNTTFADKVSEVVAKFTTDDAGNSVLPEDIDVSEEVKYAAMQVKRQRDTQAAFTRERQNSLKYKNQSERLQQQLQENIAINMTNEQRVELDTLKVTDPDAWVAKLDTLKTEAAASLQTKLDEATTAGDAAAVVAVREQLAQQYADQYGTVLTDEVIANQLPASYSKELENGDIDFDAFLKKSHEFLSKGKVVEGTTPTSTDTDDSVNFANVIGTTDASTQAQSAQLASDYENDVY